VSKGRAEVYVVGLDGCVPPMKKDTSTRVDRVVSTVTLHLH
jgi:hypothetical protein